MKKKLLNSMRALLVAAGLTAGANAWADLTEGSTTTVNFDGQTTPFVIYDGYRLGVTYALHAGSETDYYANYTCGNRNALPFAAYDFSSAVSKAVKVVASFDYNIPDGISASAYITLSDKDIHNATNGGYSISSKSSVWGNNGVIIAIGNNRSSGSNYMSVNGGNNSSKLSFNTWYTATVTVDLSTNKVSYTIKAKGGSETLVSGTDIAYLNTGDGTTANACNQIDISMANTGSIYIDNISITPYIDESEKYASYTIKYKFGETELKSAVTDRDEVKVGEYAPLIPADKEAIWIGDQKYIYESDDAATQAIAEDGSTVITVNFRKAGTYNYVLNAVDAANESTVIKELASGTAVEGETTYTRGVKAFYQGGKLYSTTISGGFEKQFTETATQTIAYSENTAWAYYAEAEDMTIDGTWSASGAYPGFYSNGSAKCLATGAYVYTNALTAGTYTVTAWARNNDKTNEFSLTLYSRDGDGNLTDLEKPLSWTSGERMEKSVVDVAIPEGCSLVFKNDGSGNSKLEFDYIYLVKTSVSVNIPSSGFGSLASAYGLDFSSVDGLTAYVATATTTEAVTLTSVTELPANSGMILKGKGGETYSIPVKANATYNGKNLLSAAVSATPIDANEAYILQGGQFHLVTAASAVPAGKAYLLKSNVPSSARALAFAFGGDEAAGVSSVSRDVKGGDFYNLQGLRVDAPTKGLYIVNGKKVIIK